MEKVLKLYTYLDGVNDSPFPSLDNQIEVYTFRCDYKRMGATPSITCTVMCHDCLDNLWTDNVYAEFNGEKFFLKQTPTSSYDNNDSRYKHELELVSERIILDNVYFYDVVDSDGPTDKPVYNSSKFTFFGTINEFAQRLNQSLEYSKVGYRVVVDNGISSEGKLISFENQFFSNALQEAYKTYEIPYYFVGKEIHIGFTDNAITHTFKYGVDESLLSIQKTNANFKITNRVTGIGSEDNIPYYYPNRSEKGESKALYNGSSDNVQIVDTNKYDKLYLSDTFKYEYISPVTSVPFGKHDYRSIDYKKLAFNQKQIVLTYFITIYEDQVLKFFQKLNGVDSKSDAHIYGVDNEFEDYILGSYEKTLKTGQYKIVIDDVATIYLDDSMGDEWVTYVLDNYFELEVSLTTLGSNGWSLNGKPVYLKDYGLSALVSPQVGDVITFEQTSYIAPKKHLMPPIYRESLGKERFYNALNNEYQDGNGGYYEFDNPYVDGKPKEQIVSFEHIKPSIVGATNANGERIDMFVEFAYDENDNDETKIIEGEEQYAHPYFFAKLRKFNGQFGFNLFDQAIDEGEMTISMTSGSCGACNFVIFVNENNKNTVQVDALGRLMRDKDGNVLFGEPQDKQNDTINNEVWVALQKDIDTFGVVMPNASNNYKPSSNDTFVILHIDLPYAYIEQAENKLKDEIIKYMSLNNSEKFTFSIKFSRIFFAENPEILEQLNENARIQIEYDNTTYELYISSYSYSMSKDAPLPEIRIELSDTLTISQNALQTAIGDVKNEILSSIGGSANIDILKQGLRYFLRKDKDDTAKGVLSFDKQIKSSDFVQGDLFGTGWSIYKDSNGNTVVETDRIVARKSLEATELVVNQETFEKGSNVFVKGGCTITKVEIVNGRYRCYYDNEEGRRFSGFKVGDQARCQRYNASYMGVIKSYWRLVTGVEEDYVELSMTDCDGTGIPEEGDDIAQLGSRYDKTRQSAIVISPDNGGSVIIWAGIDSFDLSEKNMVGMGVNPNTGRAFLYGYGDMFFGDRSLEKNYITYQTRDGETEPTLNINADIHFGKGSDGLSNLSEFKDIQNEVDNLFGQIEREFTIWYYDYEPTLDNEPAVNWVTDSDKALHDQDIFFSDKLARAWRFVNGAWVEITDERTLSALKLAEDAHAAAAEAEKNAKEAKEYIDNILPSKLEELQNQIDGAIESFFYKYDPTTSNEPASLWTTEEQKAMHLNDTFTNLESGYSWRWTVNGGVYGWTEISDTATVKALVAAGQAQDTADQKRRVFVATPYTPYDDGDLWVQGENGDIMRCSKSRASGNFVSSDWIKASKYTDNSALEAFIQGDYKNQLASIQSQMDKRAETWYQVEDPSLSWTTQELKQLHAGDLWYNINKGLSYMWSGTEWVIQGVPDEVFDTIDGKSSIYTSQPSAYKKNDLWILASDTTLDKAYKSGTIVVAKQDSDVFVKEHWTKKDCYTDDSAVTGFINGAYKTQIEEIKGQIDKKSETWYQNTDPSLNWDTTQKNEHKGDLWYNTNEDQTYIWSGTIWIPQGVPDEVFDTIDGKASIYTSQPKSYRKNDLWILAEDSTLSEDYKAGTIVVATESSEVFIKEHWTKLDSYTDDTRAEEAYEEAMKLKVKSESFEKEIEGLGVDLEQIKEQTDREFTIWYGENEPTLENEPAKDWITEDDKNRHEQDLYYSDILGKAWRFVNGEWTPITDERTIAALNKAQEAYDKASDAEQAANDLNYLKIAFSNGDEENVFSGGIVMSKVVGVINEENEVEAMLNGSDFAKDESQGKLILASGIPNVTSSGETDLEKRTKEASTRIYENGSFYAQKGIFGGFLRSSLANVMDSDAIQVEPIYNDRAWKLKETLYVDGTFEEIVLPCGDAYAGARAIVMDTYFYKSRLVTPPTIIRTEDGSRILSGLLYNESTNGYGASAILIDCGTVELIYKSIETDYGPLAYWVVVSQSCGVFKDFNQS